MFFCSVHHLLCFEYENTNRTRKPVSISRKSLICYCSTNEDVTRHDRVRVSHEPANKTIGPIDLSGRGIESQVKSMRAQQARTIAWYKPTSLATANRWFHLIEEIFSPRSTFILPFNPKVQLIQCNTLWLHKTWSRVMTDWIFSKEIKLFPSHESMMQVYSFITGVCLSDSLDCLLFSFCHHSFLFLLLFDDSSTCSRIYPACLLKGESVSSIHQEEWQSFRRN